MKAQTPTAVTGPESMAGTCRESSSTADEDGTVEIPISDLLDETSTSDSDEVADKVRRINVRGALNRERVDAYKLALKRGEQLPAITVAEIDGLPYVASGWHRMVAHAESGRGTIPGRIRRMTFVEAVDAAIEENRRHGHSPTPADVAKSLEMMWQAHPERLRWSNVKLAEQCGVSEKQVRAAEAFLPPALRDARGATRVVVRNGKEYAMKAPVSSTKNEDGWQATKPASRATPPRVLRRAVDDALRHTQQALVGLQEVGLEGMPDDVLADYAFGIKPSALAAKAATAEEFASWLEVVAKALRGVRGKAV